MRLLANKIIKQSGTFHGKIILPRLDFAAVKVRNYKREPYPWKIEFDFDLTAGRFPLQILL